MTKTQQELINEATNNRNALVSVVWSVRGSRPFGMRRLNAARKLVEQGVLTRHSSDVGCSVFKLA